MCLCATLVYRLYRDIADELLFQQNHELRLALEQSNARIDLLQKRISNLNEQDSDLREFAQLEAIDADIREMGVGGTVPSPWSRDPEDSQLDRLDQLDRQLALLESSMSEIRYTVEARSEELQHIPSMRPIPGARITSGFGRRPDPFTNHPRMHRGVDFHAPMGTQIVAPAAGKVIQASRSNGLGRTIRIDHGNGVVTTYGHLLKFSVKVGENVERGQLIGLVGNSGRSTSSHLHYEVVVRGNNVNPTDYFLADELAWEE
ncbi:MAG: peptidoglycan DD-metalloendopeptidase family protein [Calditrichaeota bacterium]|nr:peptidoglycan DD-metalloendopeptidase family protein [Candidatus Cloacimonadota bacterium]MCA9785984.1 peptidoglycan DD-metalloendopeptidase family protein [Candidatus Cloacimonadota bacterium]MCB1046875.1 peptidoglycan DD-metalloendopeptidase family protein [Calditrichota bacterium]MCB9475129.1 peptidoglycan DD-metalloendopeptidase family protein [Candidatus Delongbacteria bacterium]